MRELKDIDLGLKKKERRVRSDAEKKMQEEILARLAKSAKTKKYTAMGKRG